MSDAKRTIDIVFNGVDKTGAAVQGALRNTSNLASGVQSATQPFANAAAAAVKYEAALIATGAAITAFSIKAASDFDSGFREIATLIDEPAASLNNFRQAVLDYGADSAFSLEQVNTAVYNAISAGVDYTESLDAVTQAEKLAIAGKGDLDSTLKLLVSSLNAYGLETDKAGQFSDALFSTIRQGQTTLPELNASLQGVTTSAASLGVPFEEVLGALSALTSTGVPTSQAVTQINAVLTALLKPSSQAANLAADLGIQFNATAVESQGLSGVLNSVREATGGSAEQMAILFGRQEAIKGSMSLTGQAAQAFAANLDELQDSAGATEAAYEKLAGSFENATGRLSSSFAALGVAIGTPLLDDAGGVADALGNVLGALSDSFNQGELSQITKFIESEFSGLSEVLQGVAEALPAALSQADLSGFTDGLTAVRDALTSLFGDLDITDVNDLARALEFVGDAFNGLSQFSAGVIESFGPLLQYFADLAEKASQGGDGLRDLGNSFGIASQVNIFSGALAGAADAAVSIAAVLYVGSKGKGGLISGLRLLPGALTGVVSLLSGPAGLSVAAAGAGVALGSFLNTLPEKAGFDSISTNVGDLVDRFSGLGDQADDLVATEFYPASLDQFRDIELADNISSVVRSLLGFEDVDPEPLDNFVESLKDGGGAIDDVTGKLDDNVATLLAYPDDIKPASDAMKRLGADGQELTGNFSVVESGARKTVSALDSLAGASEDLRAEFAIAALESAGAIRVAEIEADADRAVAAFDAIASSVTSTGDVLGDLYGALSDSNIRKLDKLDITKQIEAETEARQRLLKQQEKLTAAEIRVANARADSLRRGDALIKIDGAGLQPHLEAFMWEILEAIQVRVNADGQELLLGVGA